MKYWQYLLNEEGMPVNAATIQVRTAGGTTSAASATIYKTHSGTEIYQDGFLDTDESGYFSFWCDSANYPLGIDIDIYWSKPGEITAGSVQNVYIPILYEQVDEGDSGDDGKDKLVSNALAHGWESRPKLWSVTGVSAGILTTDIRVTSAGQPSTGYDYYYDVIRTDEDDLIQQYPIVQVYRKGTDDIGNDLNDAISPPFIAQYINITTTRVWLQTSEVSGGTYKYNFTLIG
jgi:hypothetical protein